MFITIHGGLVSKFFVTDAKTVTAYLYQPTVLTVRGTATIEILARHVERIPKRGWFGRTKLVPKQAAPLVTEQLRRLAADTFPDRYFAFPEALLILASDFDADLFAALKLGKIRGFLGSDCSRGRSIAAVKLQDDEIATHQRGFLKAFAQQITIQEAGGAVLGIERLPERNVVCGLTECIMSKANRRAILASSNSLTSPPSVLSIPGD